MATVKGANIEALRNINRIRLYRYVNDNEQVIFASSTQHAYEGKETLLFSAYSKDAVGSFSASVATNSIVKSWMDSLFGSDNKLIKFATHSLTNLASQGIWNTLSKGFLYDYNYEFTGTTEFEKTFKCYLQVTNDFYEDVALPLYNLLDFILPKETSSLAEEMDTYIQEIQAKSSAVYNKGKAKTEEMKKSDSLGENIAGYVLGGVMDIGMYYWEKTREVVGSFAAVKPPEQFNQKSALKLVIGDYIVLENIYIDRIDFDIPFLTYEGGLFDHVEISMTIKGTRGMTMKTYDWVRRIAQKDSFTTKNGRTSLNELYAPKS